MNWFITLINKYIAHNDLYDEVSFMGGNNNQYQIKMAYSVDVWGLVDCINRHTGRSANIRLNKKTNTAIITYK